MRTQLLLVLFAVLGAGEGILAVPAVAAPPHTGIRLEVDARELDDDLLRSRCILTVAPGPLALCFPKWVPGAHAPCGRIDNLATIILRTATGALVPWRRDARDPWRLELTVPPETAILDCELAYIANQPDPNSEGTDVRRAGKVALINWNNCVLVPEGRPVAAIPVDCSLRLPAGWKQASALRVEGEGPDAIAFARCSLRDLVDRPLLAGEELVSLPLPCRDGVEAWLDCASQDHASRPAGLWIDGLGRSVDEARQLFGRHHFRSYRFQVVDGHALHGLGLEHAECGLSGLSPGCIAAPGQGHWWDLNTPVHEFVHSWVGKHVRPADMITPDWQTVPRFDLLWVYEGLTQHLGSVLQVRSGISTPEEWRENLAWILRHLAAQPGRTWRSVEDTALATWTLRGSSLHHDGLRRGQEYYLEGALFWLEADLIIRRGSGGQRSLDDFCRAFFGRPVEPGASLGFSLDEVLAALEAQQPHDWRGLVRRRIQEPAPALDTAFLTEAGWEARGRVLSRLPAVEDRLSPILAPRIPAGAEVD